MKKKKLADKSYKCKEEKRVQYFDALFFFVETPLEMFTYLVCGSANTGTLLWNTNFFV